MDGWGRDSLLLGENSPWVHNSFNFVIKSRYNRSVWSLGYPSRVVMTTLTGSISLCTPAGVPENRDWLLSSAFTCLRPQFTNRGRSVSGPRPSVGGDWGKGAGLHWRVFDSSWQHVYTGFCGVFSWKWSWFGMITEAVKVEVAEDKVSY